jgi:hypothetical protein
MQVPASNRNFKKTQEITFCQLLGKEDLPYGWLTAPHCLMIACSKVCRDMWKEYHGQGKLLVA